MKRIFFIIVSIMLFLNFANADESQKSSTELKVIINGVKGINGQMSIGLYNTENGWPKIGKEYKGIYLKVSGDTISYTFKDIPQGTYAIAIFHDVNMNKKLDKGLFGIPKEGYAFSNNVFGRFKPPKYKDASFLLDGKKVIQIKIKY